MGTFTRGEVVLFPFPYTDLSGNKLRPCLILSSEMKNDLLLCQITSQKIQADEYSIELEKDGTENGSLLIDSFIRCNMLFTGDKRDIKKVICNIRKDTYNEVCKKINQIILV